MSFRPIPYLSTQAAADLWKFRENNVEKYSLEGFEEELSAAGSVMELPITGDVDSLHSLNGANGDYDNALLVWRALRNLTPALARENRIWVRLCHGEGLLYVRQRWLEGNVGEKLLEQIGLHCFARTLTQCRDDNALARLWWTAFVANKFAPQFMEEALALLLSTADIRSNFIERTWMTTRPSIARAILRAMRDDSWVTGAEKNFRETMKALNVVGAGVAFEVLGDQQVDNFIKAAVDRAKAGLSTPAAS